MISNGLKVVCQQDVMLQEAILFSCREGNDDNDDDDDDDNHNMMTMVLESTAKAIVKA